MDQMMKVAVGMGGGQGGEWLLCMADQVECDLAANFFERLAME